MNFKLWTGSCFTKDIKNRREKNFVPGGEGGESAAVTISGDVSEIKNIGNHFCRRFWK